MTAPSFSFSSSLNPNPNPNFPKFTSTTSLNLHRTFKFTPIHSNLNKSPPQPPPSPPQEPPLQNDVNNSSSSSAADADDDDDILFSNSSSKPPHLPPSPPQEPSLQNDVRNSAEADDDDDILFSSSSSKPPHLPPSPPLQNDVNISAVDADAVDDDDLLFSTSSSKRSFAVATGELFIGIASRLINLRKKKSVSSFDTELSGGGDGGERIATEIEDYSQPEEIVWEQREKDVEEEKRRKAVSSPGFSFSAAGLLFPYHLGVARFLIENGYIKETTPLAGSSAGAIICAVIASGSSMEDALQATKVLAEDCRLRGTAFRLGAVLRDVLEKVLPEDAHIRCNGRVRVAVTQIGWRPRGLLIDHFDSREDLINALFTSSFIPGYLAPRPVTMFRNRICVDGGLTLFMPPTSASQTVRVCAFPASILRMQGIGISPDCNPQNKLSSRQLLNWALEPADDILLDKFYEFGYLDAAVWAQENPVDLILQEEKPQV